VEHVRVAGYDGMTLWVDGDGSVHGSAPETPLKLDRGVSDEIEEILRGYGNLEDARDSGHFDEVRDGRYEYWLPET
jgi:hypothetical protein